MAHDHVIAMSQDDGVRMNHNSVIMMDSENVSMVHRDGETMMLHTLSASLAKSS